jgi:UDP:flavonoid glycosyltransferase YjiC (YdhE family)
VYAPPMVDDLITALPRLAPELVVYDVAALAGAVAGRLIGVPSIAHGYGVLRPPDALDEYDAVAAPLWEQYGLAAPKWVGLTEDVYLDPCPPSLDAPHLDQMPRTKKIRTVERLPDAPPQDPPLVYVTFGTIFGDVSLFKRVLGGVRDLPVQVVATVGRQISPGDLGPQPDHVKVAQFIAQADILPRASAMVCHAGSGSLLGALTAGVPVVLIPQGADQFWNAEATARAGAGIVVDTDIFTPESVATAVRTVLGDAAYSARASAIGDEFAAMPSPAACFDELQATRRP